MRVKIIIDTISKPHLISVTQVFTAYSEIIFLVRRSQLLPKIFLTAVKALQLFSYTESRVTILIVVLMMKVDFFSKDLIFFSADHTKEL